MIERLKRLPIVTRVYRSLHPYDGICGCCGLPWSAVTLHFVDLDGLNTSGFFVVCEYCFGHRELSEITEASQELWRKWYELNPDAVPYSLEQMINAVREDYFEKGGGDQ